MPRICLVLGISYCLLFLPACAGKRPDPKKKPAAVVAQAPREIGTITLVNPTLGFVLIDVDMGYSPLPGTALKTFPAGTEPATEGETSILAVGAERRPPFIAADIVKGQPQKGDAVYQ